jgi:geranylgeranyl diphosphate synthase type I
MGVHPHPASVANASALTHRIEATLETFFDGCIHELASDDAAGAVPLIEEIRRVVRSGGKRLRPIFCIVGFRAGDGGVQAPILRAASALELLHTMALIHDDLMDGATRRRGEPSSPERFRAMARDGEVASDPARFALSGALLAGDLAAVLADKLLRESGFAPDALARARIPYDAIRIDMAAGQFLDVSGLARRTDEVRSAARLRGGAYTVEGPLLIGAALAGAGTDVVGSLRDYGRALGEAFQLKDDLVDGEASSDVSPEVVNDLVARARAALEGSVVRADVVRDLDDLARRMEMR